MRLLKHLLIGSMLTLGLSGLCGCSVITPYSNSFQCPTLKNGKCVSMKEAYAESLRDEAGQKISDEKVKDKDKEESCRKKRGKGGKCEIETEAPNGAPKPPTVVATTPKDTYRDNLYTELAGLIKDPVTPVLLPPKAIRALILPYPDGEKLYMPRYVFIQVEKPSWIINDDLTVK